MFNKIMESFEKSVKTAGNNISLEEQLSMLVKGKIDYLRIGDEKVRVRRADAKLFLEHASDFDISSAGSFQRRLSNTKRLIEMAETEQKQKLEETESAMFDMVSNLKYLPGVEKILSANGTVDGFEATVMSTHGVKYRFRITQLDNEMMEDFHDRKWYKDYKAWDKDRRSVPTDDDDRTTSYYEGKIMAKWERDTDEGWIRADAALEEEVSLARSSDGENKDAITAMRRAAITMIQAGVGQRNDERTILELQTIGLNHGLPPMVAAELAKKIFASEKGFRRDYLNRG